MSCGVSFLPACYVMYVLESQCVCVWESVCECVFPAGWAHFSVDPSSVLHHHITLETASLFFSGVENSEGPCSFFSLLSFNGQGNLSFLPLILQHLLPTVRFKKLRIIAYLTHQPITTTFVSHLHIQHTGIIFVRCGGVFSSCSWQLMFFGRPDAQSSISSRSSSFSLPLFSLWLFSLQASGCVSSSSDDCNTNNGYYVPAEDWVRFINVQFTQEPLTNDCCTVNSHKPGILPREKNKMGWLKSTLNWNHLISSLYCDYR